MLQRLSHAQWISEIPHNHVSQLATPSCVNLPEGPWFPHFFACFLPFGVFFSKRASRLHALVCGPLNARIIRSFSPPCSEGALSLLGPSHPHCLSPSFTHKRFSLCPSCPHPLGASFTFLPSSPLAPNLRPSPFPPLQVNPNPPATSPCSLRSRTRARAWRTGAAS